MSVAFVIQGLRQVVVSDLARNAGESAVGTLDEFSRLQAVLSETHGGGHTALADKSLT